VLHWIFYIAYLLHIFQIYSASCARPVAWAPPLLDATYIDLTLPYTHNMETIVPCPLQRELLQVVQRHRVVRCVCTFTSVRCYLHWRHISCTEQRNNCTLPTTPWPAPRSTSPTCSLCAQLHLCSIRPIAKWHLLTLFAKGYLVTSITKVHLSRKYIWSHQSRECTVAFDLKISLISIGRSELTGERPFGCIHCGKEFVNKSLESTLYKWPQIKTTI